jgi:predicted MPP superfamily phosphohydrolase
MTPPIAQPEAAPVVPAASPEPSPGASEAFTLKEILVFGSILAAIFLSANALGSHFFGLPGWIAWQALPGALSLAFIAATILRFSVTHPALRIVYVISAVWLGALNFAFFAAIGCWLVAAIALLAGWTVPRFSLAAVLFGLAFLATVYGLINAQWIRISRVTVRLAHLPESWRGRTAALVTDLHLGLLSGPDFLRRVIARLRAVQPDVVFISGDMFDGPSLGVDQLVAPWREFSASRGIFYVTGNHDEFTERNIFLNAAGRVGLRVLNNEKVTLDGLQVIGLHDSEAGNPAELRAILRRVGIDRQHPSILLAHRPVNLRVTEEEGVSLQLSGHTHGGQLWPWNLLVSRIYGRFASGLGRLGGLQVYTSNGVGTWGPPLRVGTKSEIVLIRFENEAGPV